MLKQTDPLSFTATATTTTTTNIVGRLFLFLHLPWLFLTTKTSNIPAVTAYTNNHPDPGSSNKSTQRSNNNISNNPMRAWTCHGKNQRDLVDKLCQAQIVQTPAVREVLYQVDRQYYVPQNPYMDAPQGIGLGQTISAPHMHAHVLEEMYPYLQRSIQQQREEQRLLGLTQQQQPTSLLSSSNSNLNLLDPPPHVKMLDVGCGSGYLTAAMGRWIHNANDIPSTSSPSTSFSSTTATTSTSNTCNSILGATGQVFAIDVHAHLIDFATSNIQTADKDLLLSNTVKIQWGDGWKGLPDEAPFDVIHVGAAAEELPMALVQQLKVGGVLIIPVGSQGEVQTLYKVERLEEGSGSGTGGTTATTDKDSNNNGSGSSSSSSSSSGNDDVLLRDDYVITQLLGVRYVPLVRPPKSN
jgi:protein-L-isoaspartate(D-aspartate) O-methyltransferase